MDCRVIIKRQTRAACSCLVRGSKSVGMGLDCMAYRLYAHFVCDTKSAFCLCLYCHEVKTGDDAATEDWAVCLEKVDVGCGRGSSAHTWLLAEMSAVVTCIIVDHPCGVWERFIFCHQHHHPFVMQKSATHSKIYSN